jgi:formiminotetrahydrofolate cyclodeaminase
VRGTQGSLTTVRDETVEDFLGRLAARIPAPGGGATAALHAAQSAALVAMVARYSDGARYDAGLMGRIVTEADGLRAEALRLAEADAEAFGAVAAAYRRPKDTAELIAARSGAIAEALIGAAGPPADVIRTARRLIELAAELLPAGNRNVITDVAAAAEAARAAAVTARVNIEVNLRGIGGGTIGDGATRDSAIKTEFIATAAITDEITARADEIVAAVRDEINR